MSIGDVAAEIASAANDIGNVATEAGRARLSLEEAAAGVARVTIGTSASEPGATMTAWEKAADHADRAARLLRAGNDALAQYLKAIGSGAGSPLAEPIKSGQELLNDTKDNVGRGALITQDIGNITKATRNATKLVKGLLGPKPTGASTGTPSGPVVAKPPPAAPAIDDGSAAAIAISLTVAGGVSWLRKRRALRKKEQEDGQ